MQWRSARRWWILAPSLVAGIAAGCNSDTDGLIGPQVASLSLVSGDGQTGPVGGLLPLPFVVRVEDQRKAGIAGAIVTFSVESGGGTVTRAVDTADADGYVQTTVRLGPALGDQTVAARLRDLPPVVLTANAITAPASRLVADSGDSQTGPVGGLLEDFVVVLVTDAFGNPKAGVPVNWTVGAGGGAVSAATVVSDAAGHARVRWTLGTAAGTQSVSASAGTLPAATFTATAIAADPSRIQVLSGGGQLAAPGATLADSVAIRVVDQFGNPVGGVSVTWAPAAGSGTASPSTTSTNAVGRTATRWTLGNRGGPMELNVQVSGFSATIQGAAFITFESVAAGGRSSCANDDGGVLYCWGFNGDGQLGVGQDPAGSGPIYSVPQAVPPVGNQTFASMNGGLFHNCAVTFSHVAYCWGDNNNGQLGLGTNTRSVSAPTTVKSSIAFRSVSAGRVHSCGVSIGGRAYCWGDNERGQLGASIAFDTTTVPGTTLVTFHDANEPKELGSPFGGGTYFFGPWDWSAIAAGGVHSCAIRQGGSAYCWGLGREGQLGNGTNSVDEYLPQLVGGGLPFDSIAAGFKHSCALTKTGAISCWGDNTDGQLGNGAAASSNVPVTVSGSLAFTAVSAGYAHTCGLQASGDIYCWGRNDRGQLGVGSTTPQGSPTLVTGGLQFKSLSTGDFHTCGVTTANVAYCWGDNEFGTVGDGSQTHRTAPTKIRFQR